MRFENLPKEVKEIVSTNSFKSLMEIGKFNLDTMFFQYVKRGDKLKGLFLSLKKDGVVVTVASKCHADDRFSKGDAFTTCFAKIVTNDYAIPLSFKKDFVKYQERTNYYYKEKVNVSDIVSELLGSINDIIGTDKIPSTKSDVKDLSNTVLDTFSNLFNKGKDKVKTKVRDIIIEKAIEKVTKGFKDTTVNFEDMLKDVLPEETIEKVKEETEKEISPIDMYDFNQMLQGVFSSEDSAEDREDFINMINEIDLEEKQELIDLLSDEDEEVEDKKDLRDIISEVGELGELEEGNYLESGLAVYLDNIYPGNDIMIVEGLDDAYAGVIENGEVVNVLYNRYKSIDIINANENTRDRDQAIFILEQLKKDALEFDNGVRFIKG